MHISSKTHTSSPKAAQRECDWVKVCDRISDEFGGVGTLIVPVNREAHSHCLVASDLLAQMVKTHFKHGWQKRSPRAAAIKAHQGLKYVTDQAVAIPSRRQVMAFYRDFMHIYGIRDFLGIYFKVRNEMWCASIQLDAPLASEPNLQKKIAEISNMLEVESQASYKNFIDYLKGYTSISQMMQIGCVITNGEGVILASNPLGQQWQATLRTSLPTHSSGSKEQNNDQQTNASHPQWNIMTDVGGQSDYLIISELLPDHISPFFLSDITLTSFRPVAMQEARYHHILTDELQMTSREARICSGLIDGQSVKTIAVNQKISEGNVRQHLKRMYRKTNTTGQSQLIIKILLTS